MSEERKALYEKRMQIKERLAEAELKKLKSQFDFFHHGIETKIADRIKQDIEIAEIKVDSQRVKNDIARLRAIEIATRRADFLEILCKKCEDAGMSELVSQARLESDYDGEITQ